MKIYLLDTNIISELSKPFVDENVVKKVNDNNEFCCISSIIWAEALAGIKTLTIGKKREALQSFYLSFVQKSFPIIPFDTSAASIYSDLVERLKEKGKPAFKFDTLIAATAIANNLILVTRNTEDFKNICSVSPLMLENWFSHL